jgi:cell fate regulator YaaT (PSP1 superfamily)
MTGSTYTDRDSGPDFDFLWGENPEAVRWLEDEDPSLESLQSPEQTPLEEIDESVLQRNIIEVEFKAIRRLYFENGENIAFEKGDYVIVEAEKGVDLGQVHLFGEAVFIKRRERGILLQQERKVVRKALPEDMDQLRINREKEKDASRICREKILKHKLPMKFVDSEYQFDRNRITFYFTADRRVDFRELVKDLASVFRTRIELRQIGVRDEAKRIGGIGSCGLELCCMAWLTQFHRIGTQHARVQNLPLNPLKLSGQCGRLKCCLVFEVENYVESLKRFPPLDSVVSTAHGEGRVEKVDIFRDLVYLHYEKDDTWECLPLSDYGNQSTLKVPQGSTPGKG